MNEESKIHWLLGGSILIVFILVVGYIMNQSQADTITTRTEITNTAPAVNSVFISNALNGKVDDYSGGTITPEIGATKTLHINGTVSDANGEADITGVNMAFYRSGVSGAEVCADDKNDCYKVAACTISNRSGTTADYDCEIAIDYWVDATDAGGRFSGEDWKVYTKVTDVSTSTGTDNSVTKEMATTLSLTIPASIDYGTYGLGAATTNVDNQEMVLSQQSNDQADVQVSGGDMACSAIGTIPFANQEWALTDVAHSDIASTDLSGTLTDTNIQVEYRDSETVNTTKTLYWNIEIPATGVRGTCSGTNTISVIAS